MLLSHRSNPHLNLRSKNSEVLLQQFDKGDEISILSSTVWQIYRGVVQLSKIQPDGSEVILGWASANGTFGGFMNTSTELYRAVALSDVYVKPYSAQSIMQKPLLARQFLAQFSDRLVKSERLLSIVAIKKVEERFTELLLMLKEEIGQSMENGTRLQVRFTHQQLALAIGTTRVTITRIMGNLQTRNLIYIDRDRHIVCTNL